MWAFVIHFNVFFFIHQQYLSSLVVKPVAPVIIGVIVLIWLANESLLFTLSPSPAPPKGRLLWKKMTFPDI